MKIHQQDLRKPATCSMSSRRAIPLSCPVMHLMSVVVADDSLCCSDISIRSPVRPLPSVHAKSRPVGSVGVHLTTSSTCALPAAKSGKEKTVDLRWAKYCMSRARLCRGVKRYRPVELLMSPLFFFQLLRRPPFLVPSDLLLPRLFQSPLCLLFCFLPQGLHASLEGGFFQLQRSFLHIVVQLLPSLLFNPFNDLHALQLLFEPHHIPYPFVIQTFHRILEFSPQQLSTPVLLLQQ
mmetsp:Transcript_6344/g.22612  ORF Transcript_6344/g.22612 Transcript_6344/m.22612 type:complete len:236 (-) Transcript_6344:695-1402(-)